MSRHFKVHESACMQTYMRGVNKERSNERVSHFGTYLYPFEMPLSMRLLFAFSMHASCVFSTPPSSPSNSERQKRRSIHGVHAPHLPSCLGRLIVCVRARARMCACVCVCVCVCV